MFFREWVNTRCSSVFMTVCFLSAFGASVINATETIIYSQGFESNNGSYVHTGILDTWEWGTPSSGFTDGPAAAHSGNRCWGTNLDDTVPFNSNAYLTSPVIPLPTLTSNQVMRVRFFGWIAVDFMADRGQFQVSADGSTWETKADLLLTMQGGWNEYVFDISEYSGSTMYLRFRTFTDNTNNFDPPTTPYNMAGLYIDDIAIIVADAPGIKKILTFEGSENQSVIASCPWIFTKDNRGVFRQENDIYSTARGSALEYTDYYQLNTPITADDSGILEIRLRETEQEESYTDLFQMIVVDHAANCEIVSDDHGNIFTYKNKNDPQPPSTAVDNHGRDLLTLISDADETGSKVYHGDYIDLDFSSSGNAEHPIFLLKVQGFLVDTMPGSIIPGHPKIEVQTQDAGGVWITRNVCYPRWRPALSGYDMANLFPYAKKIRLRSVSCLTGKYHLVDWAVLSTAPQKAVTITDLAPASAIRSDGTDVRELLSTINQTYAHMASGEEISLHFNEPVKSNVNKRDIIIKTRGYYIPEGTYFFYTWDGSKWVQRDGWTISSAGDQTRQFDLSLWLPDPDGNNRVRIWQDFIFDPASIDYVGLKRDSVDLTMNYATDLRNGNSVLNLVNVSDNQQLLWDWGEDWPDRIRWVEIGWVDTFINTPPSTNPVFVTNTNSPTPAVNWTYFDLDANPQVQFEIEVWSSPDGTGDNLWDPPAGYGTTTTAVYNGLPLGSAQQFFARVKAFDGSNWGTWSEAPFTTGSNQPPVANAGSDTTVAATISCLTSVALNGSASYDADGDTLSFLWTGPFGTASGAKPAVYLYPGTSIIKLIVSDGNGGSGIDSITVTVEDAAAPVPDSVSLPQITGDCSVTITTPPTATDHCAGTIVGTTDSLTFTTPGTHTVIWRYSDGHGNVSTQSQTVAILDYDTPVPDVTPLPVIHGECFIAVANFPTATDNCYGTIVGTTTDPLQYSQCGTSTINWNFTDAKGNVAHQQQTVIVTDTAAPVPDASQLPTLNGVCALSVTQLPTATDACKGTVIGTTADPLYYATQGTYAIHWSYADVNGNTSEQVQTVIVDDAIAPVPAVSQLPVINGYIIAGRCYTVRSYPAATDNCKGRIAGTTLNPLQYCNRGNFTIVWRYDDGNGNVTTQNQAVQIR